MAHFFSPSHPNFMIPNNIKAFSFCGAPVRYVDNKKIPFTEIKTEVFDHKINLDNIIILKDQRTTLMLRNIPNKYTLNNLVDEIVNNSPSFAGKFDYINLPVDYEVRIILLSVN